MHTISHKSQYFTFSLVAFLFFFCLNSQSIGGVKDITQYIDPLKYEKLPSLNFIALSPPLHFILSGTTHMLISLNIHQILTYPTWDLSKQHSKASPIK